MSDGKLMLRYHVLPSWLFGSLLLIAIAMFVLCKGYELPIKAARTSCDIAKYGLPGAFQHSHIKAIPLKMTCTDCSCGFTCQCCPKFKYATEPYSSVEYIVAALYSLGAMAVFYHLIAGGHSKLALTPQGVAFPFLMLPNLLFRRTRVWTDLGTLSMTTRWRQRGDDGEEPEVVDHFMHFYFLSGGNTTLTLSRLSVKDLTLLCRALQDWAAQPAMSPEVIEFIRKRLNCAETPADPDTTFTAMWEDDLACHINSTAFVPLERGAHLMEGRVKVLSLMASGGLSAVYLAEVEGERLVVLKESVIPPHIEGKTREKAKELFAREARLLMKLDHPAVARVIDHIVEKGRDYLMLEYVPGSTLRQYVKMHGPRSESQAVLWAREIASTLKYLHELAPPVVHRDLTPDNIVLREDGSLVLIDFGAANEYEGAATGTLIGKQSYIAPEQFRGKAEPASDIYALGCSLFYILTGSDPEALSTSHPKELRDDLSSGIDALVAALTEMETEKRIASAKELLAALESSSFSSKTEE